MPDYKLSEEACYNCQPYVEMVMDGKWEHAIQGILKRFSTPQRREQIVAGVFLMLREIPEDHRGCMRDPALIDLFVEWTARVKV